MESGPPASRSRERLSSGVLLLGGLVLGLALGWLVLTFQDSLPDARAFVNEFSMTFPVLLDETGEVTQFLYRLPGLPLSVFVKRDGIIARVHIGALTGEQVDQFVAEILK